MKSPLLSAIPRFRNNFTGSTLLAEDFPWSSPTFQFQRHRVWDLGSSASPPRVVYAVNFVPRILKLFSLTSLLLPRRAGGRAGFEPALLAPHALKNDCCLSLHLNSFITVCYHYTIFHSGLRGNRTRSGHCLRFYRAVCLL